MKTYLLPALKLTVILLVILSGLYPLIIAGIGKIHARKWGWRNGSV